MPKFFLLLYYFDAFSLIAFFFFLTFISSLLLQNLHCLFPWLWGLGITDAFFLLLHVGEILNIVNVI